MFENANLNLFVYVIIGAAVALSLLWFFVIAPIEKRNHERKMAMLQEKIRNHEQKMGSAKSEGTQPDNDVSQAP